MGRSCMLALVLSAAMAAGAADGVQTAASWVWFPERPAVEGAGQTRCLRRALVLDAAPEQAWLQVLADDAATVLVNGEPAPAPVRSGPDGRRYDLGPVLRAGENVLAFEVTNSGGPGGLIVTGEVRLPGGRTIPIRSDPAFRASRQPEEGWERPGFDDRAWAPAAVVGNAFAAPWYAHPAFDLTPFIAAAEAEAWRAAREALTALPPGLAGEAPSRAAIRVVNGTAAITLDGKPLPALLYRGTVDPFTEYGRRQIALFRDAGVHLYAPYLSLGRAWRAEGDRFQELDDTVRAYLSVDPEARLVLLLSLVPPREWMDAHPEELVRYAAGDGYNTSDEAGRVRRPSLASGLWLRDALAVWRAAVEHLEARPWGKRVIGYHPCYGIYGEWHYYGSWTEQMPDTGPAMTARFREWLRERYGDDAGLRRAWGDPAVSLGEVSVPGVAPRQQGDLLGLRDPARRRWVMDYYRCQQAVTADALESFCRAAKEAAGSRVICGAFYGYFQGVPPQTQGGHLELERLLRSPSLDYFTAPYDYSHRLMGDDGRTRAVLDAFPAAGKVHLVEADTRTHLHPVEEYGRLADTAQSVAAIRREVATALAHGAALWWCDFGAEGCGGWYDQPELIAEVARLHALAAERLRGPPRRRAPEVVVAADLESCYGLPDGAAMRAHYRLVDTVTTELYRTGAPFDSVLVSQLDGMDLSSCRVLILLNLLTAPPARREALSGLCRGRTVLWFWAPGVSDGARLDPAFVEALTGFRLGPEPVQASVVTCEPGQPLVAGVPSVPRWSLTPTRRRPVEGFLDPRQWYNPRDADFMAAHYSSFSWRVEGDTVRWDAATSDAWTDIHLRAAIPEPCDGLGLEAWGAGGAVGAPLRVVIKDADGAEFAAEPVRVPDTPAGLLFPLPAFTRAPWSRATAAAPRFPLTGAKFVLNGLDGARPLCLFLRGFAHVTGDLRRTELRQFGDPAWSCPALAIADPEAVVLGRDPASGAVLVAARGAPGSRQVLSTVPFTRREILAALVEEAGVHRYVTSPDVIVRGDPGLLALHTGVGGAVTVHLREAGALRDVLSGALLGRGDSVRVELPPNSTTLLRME